MKKRQNNSKRAFALQLTLTIALLAISAILFASSFRAAPTGQDGFYPPLPTAPAAAEAPEGIVPITVSLPVDSIPDTTPTTVNILENVNTTTIDNTSTGGLNY